MLVCDECHRYLTAYQPKVVELGLTPKWYGKNVKLTPYKVFAHERSKEIRLDKPYIDIAVLNQVNIFARSMSVFVSIKGNVGFVRDAWR